VRGEAFKRPPAGYASLEPVRERLLRFAALWTVVEEPLGDWVSQPDALERALGHWQEMAPLHRWLTATLG
jgi:hypothetical protein